jgi:hypothetical protein
VTKDYKKRDNKFTGKISKVTVELKHMSTADEQSAKNAETEAVKLAVDQK